jgi:hypothetical protein
LFFNDFMIEAPAIPPPITIASWVWEGVGILMGAFIMHVSSN